MFDIINLVYIFIIFLIVYKFYKIKKVYFLILLMHLFSVFLFNGFLFDPSYMPDQFKYFEVARNIRMFDFLNKDNFNFGNNVYSAGLFFGVFPIPFIKSLYSIGMINFLIYFSIFIFMQKKGLLVSKFIAYFYLFYPSLLLYSSVALRDMLIFSLMFLGTYFILIKKKNLIGFIILFFMVFIKFQNLIIIVSSFVISMFFSIKINVKHSFWGILAFLIVFYMFIDFFSIEKINFYRAAFYYENIATIQEKYNELNTYYEFLKAILPSILKFIFRPLPWVESGGFKVIQFFENIIVCILILYILCKNTKYKLWVMQEVKFLNIILFLSLAIYGLVSYNSGTAVRYKFPFITIYIIYSWYYIFKARQIFLEKKLSCVE